MITVAYEYWSPDHWPVYAPMATSWPLGGDVADLHSISWSRYGATAGVWRLLDILESRRLKATFPTSALAAEQNPESVRAIVAAGHEIAAHSVSQDVMMPMLAPEAELEVIERCTAAFAEVSGVRPTGWLSPRATASPRTAELLARSGYLWSGDHNDAELPRLIRTPHGPLVAIMHSDISDVRAAPAAIGDVQCATLDYLLSTGRQEILNLTVHAHVSGRPLLAAVFERVLDHVVAQGDDVWIATHAEIAQWTLRTEESDTTRRV
ncbi:polysaccharide deacetylase family protein [Amycolatopsis sp. RM579]|uniref:Polysaccharide deacetylase family protein n=2 Tax=Amycolatopsis pithecellobii TaxID=664692 RepID=A0A6N7ZB59_9PSEU|nr:polysaccharide deacetylase family protein [Amycolatopsis pithecellobii]